MLVNPTVLNLLHAIPSAVVITERIVLFPPGPVGLVGRKLAEKEAVLEVRRAVRRWEYENL